MAKRKMNDVTRYLMKRYAADNDFDPKKEFPYEEGCTLIKTGVKHNYLAGEAVELFSRISDQEWTEEVWEELDRAYRYLMVVIDARKYLLNYERARIDYGIDELKEKYAKA